MTKIFYKENNNAAAEEGAVVQGGVKGATDVFSDEFTDVLPDAVHFTFELN